MAIIADWTVTGAGITAYNGDYTENGTYGGKPAYEIDGGGRWFYWSFFVESWLLATGKGSGPQYIGEGAQLPANPWADYAGGGGTPPTVSVAQPSTYDLHVISHDLLIPSIGFTPSPDNNSVASPQNCDFDLNYDEDTSVTLTAPAVDPDGWDWDGWYVDGIEQTADKSYNFNLIGHTTVVATYTAEATTYDLYIISHDQLIPAIVFTPSPDNNSVASPEDCDFDLNYDENTNVTLTAPAVDPDGWDWDGWYMDGIELTKVTADKSYNFNVVGETTIVATYSAEGAGAQPAYYYQMLLANRQGRIG